MCKRGHLLTPDNVRPAKDGTRRCKACRRATQNKMTERLFRDADEIRKQPAQHGATRLRKIDVEEAAREVHLAFLKQRREFPFWKAGNELTEAMRNLERVLRNRGNQ